MGKPTGFMDYERKDSGKEKPLSRLEHWNEFDISLTDADRREQAARCMECGVPFCQSGILIGGMVSGCPLNNLIPEWNELIYKDKWEKGLERLLKTNNFPEFTSRVCPAPCEHGCTAGLNGRAVSIKANERFLADKGMAEGKIKPEPPTVRTDKKVAVIGSGPAGLASADFLNRLGHTVTVFEREDKIGGLLMYGIPNMKLEKNVIDFRVDLLKAEGVNFKTSTDVPKDISFEELDKEFDAVILAVGASKPRDLKVPGRELKGIHMAVEFLTKNTKKVINKDYNGDFITAKDKNVIVIGGGDTGTDCVATSLRHGCIDVKQFEIMAKPAKERTSDNPWPQYAKTLKVDYGQEEYVAKFGEDPRRYCTTVKEFIGDENNNVNEVITVDVEWIKDETGRVTLKTVENSEKSWKADLVLLAMGFVGVEDYVANGFDVKLDVRGNVEANDTEFKSSKSKVFVAGDARRGPSLVVWAINEGRRAALQVDRFLMES